MQLLAIRHAVRVIALSAALLPTVSQAVIVTDLAVDSQTRHYLIDPDSTVTYTPGFFGGTPGTYAVTGSFDAVFSHYRWSYFQDGDPSGSLGTFFADADWMRMTNPVVVGTISPAGFELPSYWVRRSGSSLSGDDHPCTFPAGPDTFCSGFVLGPLSSLTGNLGIDTLAFAGFQPTGFSFPEGFSFSITATEAAANVPVPATGLLVGLGLLLLARATPRRQRGGRCPKSA